MDALRTRFIKFDNALAAVGVPPLTPWWRDGIGRWLDAYERGGVLELWAAAGRGSAKSTALYKLALFFTLFVDFAVPPGEVHFAIVLSRLKEEAGKGIAIIARWLDLLGMKYRLAGDVIEIEGMPRGIRVVAASVAASSGWRAFFVGKDERSKWPSGGADEVDASEIDTSAAAMTATHAAAPRVAVGSAWLDSGVFHETIMAGSSDQRVVLGPAPTWIVAPHISEADCRRKEPNAARFAREYACEATSGLAEALTLEEVNPIDRPLGPNFRPIGTDILVIDSAAGKHDGWSYMFAGYVNDDGRRVLSAHGLGAFEGRFCETLAFTDVVAHVAGAAKALGVSRCYGDQFMAYALESAFGLHGMTYIEKPWSQPTKAEALSCLRRMLSERTILVEPGIEAERLKAELLSLQERLLPGGAMTVQARRTAAGHADRASLMLMLARLEAEGELAGSPLRPTLGRPLVIQRPSYALDMHGRNPDDARGQLPPPSWQAPPPEAKSPRVAVIRGRSQWAYKRTF